MERRDGRFYTRVMPAEDDDELGLRQARLAARDGLAGLLRRSSGRDRLSDEAVLLDYRADQSLGHLAESVGIPRLEIGRALVDGAPWPLDLSPPGGSLVELFPVEEPLRFAAGPSFLLDLHLGRLFRLLRLLGLDVLWWSERGVGGPEIVSAALAEERVLLTRDRALLFRREFREGARLAMLLRSTDPYEQLLAATRRFGLASGFAPFSRCADCGSLLRTATREEARPRVPALVADRYEEFFLCPGCGKAYWKGDHFRNIEPFLARLRHDLGAP